VIIAILHPRHGVIIPFFLDIPPSTQISSKQAGGIIPFSQDIPPKAPENQSIQNSEINQSIAQKSINTKLRNQSIAQKSINP